MNKNAIYVALFAVLCTLAGVLVGASITRKTMLPPPMPNFAGMAEHFRGYGPMMPFGRPGPERLFEALTIKLNLSDKQQTEIKEILERTRQDIDKMGQNIRSAIDEIRERSNTQIMNILKPDQQKKFKTLLKESERNNF